MVLSNRDFMQMDEKHLNDKRAEGIQQVQGYQQLPDIQTLEKLSCWVIVTDGEEVVAEQVGNTISYG